MLIVQEQGDAQTFVDDWELVRRLHHIQQRIQQQEEECDRLRGVQSGQMVWPL